LAANSFHILQLIKTRLTKRTKAYSG